MMISEHCNLKQEKAPDHNNIDMIIFPLFFIFVFPPNFNFVKNILSKWQRRGEEINDVLLIE